ncbi:MAG: type II secretion system protein [Candidatus Pacebacteria bacterium]|nr:type II secretion system protein [Candidatus Paceibacterota bacterium]
MRNTQLKYFYAKGFTLVEILVVIAIMSMLSAIVYTSFDSVRAKGRDQQRITAISDLQLTLEMYYMKYKQYPETLDSLVNDNFIQSIPIPPTSKQEYGYNYLPLKRGASEGCSTYQLWTTLETSDSQLSSKKGFNSSNLPVSDISACISGGVGIDASSKANVYDVMPQI